MQFSGSTVSQAVRPSATGEGPVLDKRIEVPGHWDLYTSVAGRPDFGKRAKPIEAEAPDFEPPSTCRRVSIVVYEERLRENPAFRDRLEREGWKKEGIREFDGRVVFSVYHRAFPPTP
jgi:hypothetical protein